ncbi:MAG: aspartate ammonia-lyase [Actinomycetota bacterium]
MSGERIERDALGEVRVPAEAYYGAETVRAVENFKISGRKPRPELIRALAEVKVAAARANRAVGALPADVADAIARSAEEVAGGELAEEFLVDPYQAGAGTSTHMNVNEVVANRAEELLGGSEGKAPERGSHDRVHPNDHVNAGQSSNDVFPTAVRIAVLEQLPPVLEALDELIDAFEERAAAFADVVKAGRTHLQDALPVTLGSEFGAYAEMLRRARQRVVSTAEERLARVPLGGTAIGTGFGAAPGYRERALEELRAVTGLPLTGAENLLEAVRNLGDLGDFAGALKSLAVAVTQICNDLRMLSMGPRTGLAEFSLPEVQPGSSIMPGKVNPSIVEMVNMVCLRVIGAEQTVSLAVAAGQLDMSVMTPLIADELLEVETLLANGLRTLAERCVAGIEANVERDRGYAEASLAMATALRPALGYDRAAELAMEAHRTGKTLREVVESSGALEGDDAKEILDPGRSTGI